MKYWKKIGKYNFNLFYDEYCIFGNGYSYL